MAHIPRMKVKITLNLTGHFVRNGSTEFTFRGVATTANGGDEEVTLVIHSNYVSERSDMVELSLLRAGSPIVFDVGGMPRPGGLFEVDHFYGVTHG